MVFVSNSGRVSRKVSLFILVLVLEIHLHQYMIECISHLTLIMQMSSLQPLFLPFLYLTNFLNTLRIISTKVTHTPHTL